MGALLLVVLGTVATVPAVLGQEEPPARTRELPQQRRTLTPSPPPEAAPRPGRTPAPRTFRRRPNILLVLLDDFSTDLVPTMASMRTMARRGADYRYAFVADSLCCVSRAVTFTGQYPHQTRVFTNTANWPNPVGPVGGWTAFRTYGGTERSVAVRLQASGYTTGYVGKYLNEYEWRPESGLPPAPPGWDDLRVVFGDAYDGWDFHSTRVEDGELRLRHHPAPPASAPDRVKDRAYAGTVIHRMARRFVDDHADDRRPWFLQVAPYAVHSRVGEPAYPGDPAFPPAFRDRAGAPGGCGLVPCRRLGTDDLPGWDDDRADNDPVRADGTRVPSWNTGGGAQRSRDARALRNRARMARSADRMISDLLERVDENTVVVVTSDNGMHLGQHGLPRGKGTGYASDVQVPLLVTGPGIAPGPRRDVVSNVDLAPTLEELARLPRPAYRSGISMVPSLHRLARRRTRYAFLEHTWHRTRAGDPDAGPAEGPRADRLELVPSYLGVRSRDGLLLRLDLDHDPDAVDPAWEFYPYAESSWERTNRFADPRHARTVRRLRARLAEFDACRSVTRRDPVPRRCRALRR